MSNIKFKVWSNDEKKFLEGWETSQLVIRPLSGTVTDGATVPNVTLLQSTGLFDENHKEIFGGYIVEYNKNKYLVKYEIGSFMLIRLGYIVDIYDEFKGCWNDDVYPISQLYWNTESDEKYVNGLTIVGNIYENPELLEKDR